MATHLPGKRNSSPDELKNAQTDEQIRGLILNMKSDLVGIVSFLDSIGVRLDDHYMMVRHLAQNFDGTRGNG